MKKIKLGLFPKVLIAIVLGSLLGLVAPDVLVRILKTFNVLFAQILKFIVPLLVLGLVTPSVANLGKGAGKMLIAVMTISYLSTVGAGLFSYGCASGLLPHYLEVGELSATAPDAKTFAPYVELKIPPICDILTALLLSFMVGVGIIFTNSTALKRGFDEFGNIVKLTIKTIHDMMAADKKLRNILKKQVKDANGDIDISWINDELITFVADRLGHDQRYAIDPTKIKEELGWYPETMFADGIVKTIKWNLEHQDWIAEVTSGDYQKYYEQMYGNR